MVKSGMYFIYIIAQMVDFSMVLLTTGMFFASIHDDAIGITKAIKNTLVHLDEATILRSKNTPTTEFTKHTP